jgi:hypothetical protein
MVEEMRPDEAADALAQVRARQKQVIDEAQVPVWYWWVIGVLMVAFTAAVESGEKMFIGVGTAVFVLGVVAATGFVIRRALQVQVRNDLLGLRGAGLIVGFVLATVAISLAVAFSLQAAGVGHPATIGNAVTATILIVGGPWLSRALRRIMLSRRTGGSR